MKKQNILIDTDMGNDDIMAICYLLLKKQYNIAGISTVNGVATGENGLVNLNSILDYLKSPITSLLGSTKALKEKNISFPQYDTDRANNLTLLKDLPLKQNRLLKTTVAVEDFIYEQTIKQKTLLLCLGPLTNIAKIIEKYGNAFTSQVEGIYMMGGGLKRGNVSPFFQAEYNIFLDPEAAQIVFDSSLPITMIGIDATDNVPTTKEFTEKVGKINPTTKEAKIIKEIIINNNGDFRSFYDPLSVFLLTIPSAIKEKIQTGISIELSGKKRGKTIINPQKSNVNVILSVNAALFYNEFLQLLERN